MSRSTNFRSYSQIGQDKWVVETFRGMKRGFFLDVGAGDGIDLSNTYALEQSFSWKGVCIEPHSKTYPRLVVNRVCKTNDSFVLRDDEQVDFIEYENVGAHQDYFSSTLPDERFEQNDAVFLHINRIPPVI